MVVPTYNPSPDLSFLSAALPELETYLLSDELYWPLGGADLPRLTFGGIFLALARLSAVADTLTPAQSAELTRSNSFLETTRAKWPAAMDRKLDREIKSRLDLWTAFLQDCADHPRSCAENYPQQVTYRAMLTLLFDNLTRPLAPDSPHPARLAASDRQLHTCFRPGPFGWDAALEAGFDAGVFWFLYGSAG